MESRVTPGTETVFVSAETHRRPLQSTIKPKNLDYLERRVRETVFSQVFSNLNRAWPNLIVNLLHPSTIILCHRELLHESSRRPYFKVGQVV